MNKLKRYFQFQVWRLRGALLCTGVILAVSLSALPDAWALQATPTTLSFQAVQGGTSPSSQILNVLKNNNRTESWSSSGDATWLSVSPTTGSITSSAQISVSVNSAGMAVGTYAATVMVTATKGGSISVPVALTVTAAPVPPAIGTSPTSLSFTAQQGSGNPAAQTLSLNNTGGGTLTWSASDNAPWLTLSPASGTGNGTVALSAATGTLTAGSYSGAVTLSATGATTVTVPVSFTVTAAPVIPTIGLSPTAFTVTATQGAANPTSQTLNITNPGTGTLTWSVADNANWLTLAPASGTTITGTSPVTLSVNTAGLLAGSFTATMTVTATGATNTPQTIPVTLTLSAPATSSATLNWIANTEPTLASYRIYRSTTPGVYGAAVATVQIPATTYLATGLNVGSTYYFTVTAVNSAGYESLLSNEVSKSIY